MFADTVSTPKTTRTFKLPGLSALKRVAAGMFRKADTLAVGDLPESHYRDLGLSAPRHNVTDTRTLIILGPM